MKNFTFHKGSLSEIKIKTKAVYVCRDGYAGNVIKNVGSNDLIYELHIATPTERTKLTTITSSLWELRRNLLKENIKQVAIQKESDLFGKLTWEDIKKCLIETFNGTNIKVTLCEF